MQVGKKVWFERTPAVIKMVIENQGCVVLETEDGASFPDAVWRDKNDGAFGGRENTVKVEIFDEHVYWYRSGAASDTEQPQNPISSQ